MTGFVSLFEPASQASSLEAWWSSIMRRSFPTVDHQHLAEATAIMLETDDRDVNRPIDLAALDERVARMVRVLDGASPGVGALQTGALVEAETTYAQAIAPMANRGILVTKSKKATDLRLQAEWQRRLRAELKLRLKTGSLTLKELLDQSASDEVMAKMTVVSVIESLPGLSKVTARRLMEEIGISETRKVAGLGQQQRQRLLERLT